MTKDGYPGSIGQQQAGGIFGAHNHNDMRSVQSISQHEYDAMMYSAHKASIENRGGTGTTEVPPTKLLLLL